MVLSTLFALVAGCGTAVSPGGDGGARDDSGGGGSDGATVTETGTGGGDGGPAPDARNPADDPLYADPTCTSGSMWTRGNRGSENMNPGMACIDCHTSMRDGPSFSFAGTVYPSGAEPDRCYGTNVGSDGSSITIEVTDSTGRVVMVSPNAVGNFESRTRITPPYRARIIAGSTVRVMNTEQTSGDCNSCHTDMGAEGAPGRITVPF